MSNRSQRWLASVLLGSAASLACLGFAGCERKETIVDVKAPDGGGVEVERDVDTGEVDVEVKDN